MTFEKRKELKGSSTILKLDLVMKEGLLRVNGRLDKALEYSLLLIRQRF